MTDWYRQTSWTETARTSFESRLERAHDHNRAQYLRIQAETLAEAELHEQAIPLFHRSLKEEDSVQVAFGLSGLARSQLALGRVEEALQTMRACVSQERDVPTVCTSAWLDLAFTLAMRSGHEDLEEARSLLRQADRDPALSLVFPVQRFQFFAAKALSATSPDEARRAANTALAEADRRESGLAHHEQLGLVQERYAEVRARLAALTGEDSIPSRLPTIATISLASLAISLLLLLLSSLAYPGGSWANEKADGFHPFLNYWCDLMRTQAVNGQPNGPSLVLARAAFAALGVSLALFWWVAASQLPLRRWAMTIGLASSAGVALLAALPYDTQRWPHVVTTLAAGGFGLIATVLVLAGNLREKGNATGNAAWGIALVGAAGINVVVYVNIVLGGDEGATLPIVQKFGTLFLALWMTSILLEAKSCPSVDLSRHGLHEPGPSCVTNAPGND